ncbi:MAG: hypothetical protein AB7D05_04205 [Mangrovibacterium sp.]
MFFIGLTGTFMPYLLLTGMLIAFMLEASQEEMYPPVHTKNILLVCMPLPETEINPEFGTFPFSVPNAPDGKQEAEYEGPGRLSVLPVPEIISNARKYPHQPVPYLPSGYPENYSGLSPPCMIG